MSRFLISVGSTLACVLAALFFLPQFIDWNHFRGAFEHEASRLLARDVRVGGEVNLRLLPTPFIRFDRVRVAGAGSGEPLLKADEFTVRLAVAPLFRGTLEATQVEVTRPVLTLVANEDGTGNWGTLATGRPQSTFLPSSVTLRDVRISDATVVLKASSGEELGRFNASNADFSATALEGPYKLQAMVMSPSGERELRLSTAKAEGDGTVRFKATVRAEGLGPTYTLDGQLADLTGQTRITGDLAAKIPLPGEDGGTAPRADGSRETEAQPGQGHGLFDLKAALDADTSGGRLSNLSLSFDSGGRPQLAEGDAQFHWRGDQPARIRLEARWLDLDRITGADASHSPLALLARLATAVDRNVPDAGRATQAIFSLDQATLAGEVVSNVHLALDKTPEGLKLRELRAGLPGGTRLQASGTMTQQQSDASFDGEITLHGISLNRFLGWAAKGYGIPETQQDGSFAARGGVTIGAHGIAGHSMMLQLAGNTLSGDASWDGRARVLTLALEATSLDASPLIHGGFEPTALISHLWPRPEQRGDNHAGSASAAAEPPLTSSIRLRIARLGIDSLVLNNLVADISTDRDAIRIPQLKLASDDGLELGLQGSVTGLSADTPNGSFDADVSIRQAGSLQRFLEVLRLPEQVRPSLQRAGALVPMRLSALANVGGRSKPSLDLSVDGVAAGSRVTGRLSIDDASRPWREQRIDASTSVENPEISALLAQLLPAELATGADKEARIPGRVTLTTVGSPARGMVSLASLDAPGVSGEFRGRFTLDETSALGADGEGRITTDDLGYAAALFGLGRRPGLRGLAGRIPFSAKLERGRLALEASTVRVGSTSLGTRLDIDLNGARPHVEGIVRAQEVSLPGLLTLMEESRSTPTQTISGIADKAQSPWPESAIDLSRLTRFDGQVRVDSSSLVLASGIALADATIDAKLTDGQLGIRVGNGRALGGQVTIHAVLEKSSAGASLKGEAQLANASFAELGGTISPAAEGEFSAQVKFAGIGLSPRGLITGLHGKGSIRLGQAHLNRMTPGAINAAALAALAAPGDSLAGTLRERLREGLRGGTLALGPREIPFEITNGVARSEATKIQTPDGIVTNSTTVDLETLAFDSEWRIEPKAAGAREPSGMAALPGVSVVYAGRLAQWASIEPRLQADALERELNVRKMERYVDELERLRRQDEERARREAERLRNEELERQRQQEEQSRARQGATDAPVDQLPTALPDQNAQPDAAPRSTGAKAYKPLPEPNPWLNSQRIMREMSERGQ